MEQFEYEFNFNYEIKKFSNRSSDSANPQTRGLSIIISFNSIFQGTDYYYIDIKKVKNADDFDNVVGNYLVSKKIPKDESVYFPLYTNNEGQLVCRRTYKESIRLSGFLLVLKKDIRSEYEVFKITENVKTKVFQDLLLEVKDYNSFLDDDVWLIVVSKPHGRNFIVYGKDRIEDKLFEINKKLEREKRGDK